MARGSTLTAARTPVSARLGKGCNKEPGHCSLAPRVAAVKGSICRVAKAAPGRQQPVRSVFRTLRLAATAFAKQGRRCGAFEQTLSHACLLQGVPACMLFLACRNWPGRVACIAAGSDRGGPFSDGLQCADRTCTPSISACAPQALLYCVCCICCAACMGRKIWPC